MECTLPVVHPVAHEVTASAQEKIDGKTKPPGSLGLLEEAALKMCRIQNRLDPQVLHKKILVFAADHGVVASGVSAYPAEVTPQMVLNFLAGGAAINTFCRLGGIDMAVIDVGVDYEFPKPSALIDKKVRRGTRDFSREKAMTRKEAETAVLAGTEVVGSASVSLIGLGEMGIGNTTAAAALISVFTGASPRDVAGRGTGIDDVGLERKIAVIEHALALHAPDPADPWGVLEAVGGYEIGAMAGAAIAAASAGAGVVLDGLISTAAGLLAAQIEPNVKDYLFSGHRSVEVGQRAALDKLELTPLVDLGLRLGEGTGAALAMHHIEAACAFVNEMSSFENAGVSGRGTSIPSRRRYNSAGSE